MYYVTTQSQREGLLSTPTVHPHILLNMGRAVKGWNVLKNLITHMKASPTCFETRYGDVSFLFCVSVRVRKTKWQLLRFQVRQGRPASMTPWYFDWNVSAGKWIPDYLKQMHGYGGVMLKTLIIKQYLTHQTSLLWLLIFVFFWWMLDWQSLSTTTSFPAPCHFSKADVTTHNKKKGRPLAEMAEDYSSFNLKNSI